MNPRDRHERVSDRVRWAEAMCQVLISSETSLDTIVIEAIAGIAGHLSDAQEDLEELYQSLPYGESSAKPSKDAKVTALRSKHRTPDENAPEPAA